MASALKFPCSGAYLQSSGCESSERRKGISEHGMLVFTLEFYVIGLLVLENLFLHIFCLIHTHEKPVLKAIGQSYLAVTTDPGCKFQENSLCDMTGHGMMRVLGSGGEDVFWDI